MLETSRVRRVTRDGYVNTFLTHDSHTLTNVVSAVALNFRTKTVRISFLLDNVHLTCHVVELSLYIRETVDTRDDLSGILT